MATSIRRLSAPKGIIHVVQSLIKDVPVILQIALMLNRKITPYKYTAKKRTESLGESSKRKESAIFQAVTAL